MKASVKVTRWPQALIDKGWPIDTARSLFEKQLQAVWVTAPAGVCVFTFTKDSTSVIDKLLDDWVPLLIAHEHSLQNISADIIIVNDFDGLVSGNVLLQDVIPAWLPCNLSNLNGEWQLRAVVRMGAEVDDLVFSNVAIRDTVKDAPEHLVDFKLTEKLVLTMKEGL